MDKGMPKLKYCYHSHTKRCGHASGEDEEYVVKAIELGIKRLGFSDHIFLPSGYSQPGIRGDFEQLENYLESAHFLKEKYKNSVDLLVGFEAEYYPEMVDYYKWLLKEKVDYLILGQHCHLKDGALTWYFHKDSPTTDVIPYVNDVIDGLKSGLFKYLAHPDLFMHTYDGFDDVLERESRRLLKACEDLQIPIELNLCGMRRRYYDEVNHSYPNRNFFSLVKDYNIKVVMGIDAHDPNNYNQEEIDRAIDFANRCGFVIDWDYTI